MNCSRPSSSTEFLGPPFSSFFCSSYKVSLSMKFFQDILFVLMIDLNPSGMCLTTPWSLSNSIIRTVPVVETHYTEYEWPDIRAMSSSASIVPAPQIIIFYVTSVVLLTLTFSGTKTLPVILLGRRYYAMSSTSSGSLSFSIADFIVTSN